VVQALDAVHAGSRWIGAATPSVGLLAVEQQTLN